MANTGSDNSLARVRRDVLASLARQRTLALHLANSSRRYLCAKRTPAFGWTLGICAGYLARKL